MSEFKSGFVTIIGETNAGKSTLLNYLTNEKVAITTFRPQTTRTAIKAILNLENAQIIFIDTPGIHEPQNKLGKTMIETAKEEAGEGDILLFLVDGTKKEIGKNETLLLEEIKSKKKPTILLINKIDLVSKEQIAKVITLYKDEYSFEAIIPISALKNKGREEVLKEIEKILKPGPMYYDIEEYTDQTQRQLVEEVIREKALKLLQEEVPHGLYMETEKMKRRKTKTGEAIYDIEVTIYCLKNSHKGIIIGKNGEMLKRIGQYARQDLEKMLQTKINLKLWVKVKEDWQNNEMILEKFKKKKK